MIWFFWFFLCINSYKPIEPKQISILIQIVILNPNYWGRERERNISRNNRFEELSCFLLLLQFAQLINRGSMGYLTKWLFERFNYFLSRFGLTRLLVNLVRHFGLFVYTHCMPSGQMIPFFFPFQLLARLLILPRPTKLRECPSLNMSVSLFFTIKPLV